MVKISKVEWEIIDARVNKATQRLRLPTLSIGLLAITLEQIFPDIHDQLSEVITDGSEDQGIDAIKIIEKETSAEISLFQSKYRDKFSSSGRTINDNEVMKVSHFLNSLFNKSDDLVNHNNLKLKEAVKRIWALHAQGKICRYKVIFCSNGAGLSLSAMGICDNLSKEHSQVSYEYYGAKEIIREMSHEGRMPENGSLQVIGKQILERSDGDVRGVIASVDASSFIDLITKDDGLTIKRHVFDDNLRVFLGNKGGYNPSIIQTASSKDSYLFWYLNNGITITCKKVHYNKGHSDPKLQFEDFQIVNGAQTSHSLIEARRFDHGALNDVVLMVRVYATDRSDIAERVAVATNSQARIQGRDLRANNQVMKKLELGLFEQGYFFERKRNLHLGQEVERRIDALKLGQIILSYDLLEPDKAKTESDSIFGVKFDKIFNENHDIKDLVSLIELYSIIENLRDDYQVNNRDALESGGNHQYLIYGHWFILYACKLLLIKSKLREIPTGKEAEALVNEAINLVAEACNQQKAVAHYRIFRNARTKDKIVAEISGKQLDFFFMLMQEN
ncbi:MAG: AIPR family protein [Maricaulaceae bacterium]